MNRDQVLSSDFWKLTADESARLKQIYVYEQRGLI